MSGATERPRFEVADIVRAHAGELRRAHDVSVTAEKVLRHIESCRTAVLGGHVDACDSCGHTRVSYNSCRDRHCPKCQGPERAAWLEQRLDRLLPVPYFHVVFTLPEQLNPLALGNRRVVFGLLFAAAAASLQDIAADPKHLGARLGITAVLHTWGQNLLFHPHLHCVVTGGGLSSDGQCWIAGRERFLLPVKALGKLFRGRFVATLDRAWREDNLRLGGSTGELAYPARWSMFKDELCSKSWVVYSKPPFGGPEHVFRYLGRYTHRVAISNGRITDFADSRVTFTIKDYADGAKKKLMTLDAVEFLRRFILHVLPKGFVRIRHYGLSSASNLKTHFSTARGLLEPNRPPSTPKEESVPWWERLLKRTGLDVFACPSCSGGRLVRTCSLADGSQLIDHASLRRARPP